MTIIDTSAPESPSATPPLDGSEGDVVGATPPGKGRRKAAIAALTILLLLLALLFGWYLMNRKPLSELPGLSQTKVPHYQFSIYGAARPLGVAVTPSGDRIYVTESGGKQRVVVFDRSGKAVGTLKPPTSASKGSTPVYVAINPKTQDVYVSDRLTASIYIYNAKGVYLRTFAPKGDIGGKWNPLGLAFAPDGTMYATDLREVPAKSHRVLKFGPDGTLVRTLGTPGQLSFPNGIAVDSQGNIEVTDSNNGRLVIFSPYGKMLATISRGVGEGDLGLPRGAAVDDADRLYVVDTADHMVRIYSIDKAKAAPTFTGAFGAEGQDDAMFQYPNGIATDKRAHVYITDRENNRVQVWGY